MAKKIVALQPDIVFTSKNASRSAWVGANVPCCQSSNPTRVADITRYFALSSLPYDCQDFLVVFSKGLLCRFRASACSVALVESFSTVFPAGYAANVRKRDACPRREAHRDEQTVAHERRAHPTIH